MLELTQPAMGMTQEQEMIATKRRLETFQFRRSTTALAQPAPLSPTLTNGRTHSRNGSVTSVPLSASSSSNSVLSMTSELSTSSSDSRPSSLAGGRSRPTSHHRRRSSVSTRVESAEMMGVALPDLPPSSSDDNVNFGDRDSIRRRALMALEGRNNFNFSTSTVEIPELSNQGVPQKSFEPKVPSAMLPYTLPVSLSGKRDSFGKFPSSVSSLKDQLHTLLEEEEEEEEEMREPLGPNVRGSLISDDMFVASGHLGFAGRDKGALNAQYCSLKGSETAAAHTSPPVRHKPANLTLRPLSLTTNSSASLPTPGLTPNIRHGLRTLSLTPASDGTSITLPGDADLDSINESQDRWNSARSESPVSSSVESLRCHSSTSCTSSSNISPSPKRQGSISYIRSKSASSPSITSTTAGLPTPGATPTSEKRQSTSSTSSFGSTGDRDRRNASEEMFLHQSHASLLARIAELERALQSHPRSRQSSLEQADCAGFSNPRDEMLQLVADLKAERDELNKDVDVWMHRVKDLERMKGVLERRLDAEKREGWLKGEKLGLLEVEKNTLNRQLQMKEEELASVSRKLEATQMQLRQVIQDVHSVKKSEESTKRQLFEARSLLRSRKDVEDELLSTREALAAEHVYREQLIRQLDAAGILKTPKVGDKDVEVPLARMVFNIQTRSSGPGFKSVDSACTTVDAEDEAHESIKAPFLLKAVEEESELHFVEENDDLAHYEDEGDLELGIMSPSRSVSPSSSDDDLPRSLYHLRLAANATPVPSGGDVPLSSRSISQSPSPFSSPCPTPIPPLSPKFLNMHHADRASLSKTWTFPRSEQAPHQRSQEEVDRFFGCLEDIDNSPPLESCSEVDSRSIFSQRLQFGHSEDEEMPPFILPVQKDADVQGILDSVIEVDEHELDDDTTFPISVSDESLGTISPTSSERTIPFLFPRMRTQARDVKPSDMSTSLSGDAMTWSEAGTGSSLPVPSLSARISTAKPSGRSGPVGKPAIMASGGSGARVLPPSRIPPPSPPMFLQTRTTRSSIPVAPSPPKRKPVPSALPNPTLLSPVSPVKAVEPTRKIMFVPQAGNGSTFIPQLKSPSTQTYSFSPHAAGANYSSSPFSSTAQTSTLGGTLTHKPVQIDWHNYDADLAVAPSSQPYFQTFTNLFPLPGLMWMTSRPQANRGEPQKPAYVSKEKQLARLKKDLTSHREDVVPFTGADRCTRCKNGLISL
ncbi:hypothetical protein M0805_005404 [Coniferiporia weirii]|nr:hypothetical protein M0805_005404 [Coniferiporia weirii]